MGGSSYAIAVSYAILLAPLIVCGCGSGSRTGRESGNLPPEEYEAEFRPSEFDPPPATALGEPVLSSSDSLPEDRPSPVTGGEELVPGFRVQVFSSTDIDEAGAVMAAAEERLPGEWFYLVYEPPAYKVRAGDFLQRHDADRLARTLRSLGYNESWTVPDRVVRNPGVKPPPQEQPPE